MARAQLQFVTIPSISETARLLIKFLKCEKPVANELFLGVRPRDRCYSYTCSDTYTCHTANTGVFNVGHVSCNLQLAPSSAI